MVEEPGSQSLSANLLALPLWAPVIALGLLGTGVGVGFTLLLIPGLSDSIRTAGAQLLVIALPVLAILVGLLGASWARTKRIDGMVAAFLRHNVGDKLQAYLVGDEAKDDGRNPYPPLFTRMDASFRDEIASYCYFRFYDRMDRRFDIVVKSNVFNFEVTLPLRITKAPPAFQAKTLETSYNTASLTDWKVVSADPLVQLVSATIHGSLAEGYTVYVRTDPDRLGAICVTYRLRQKLQANFLTSPYLRRYFAEDAAIACYFFFAEALAHRDVEIAGSPD